MKPQQPKNPSTRISANEINRFVYCPYAWYYQRYYGQKVLKEKYRALKNKNSQIESNFKKGLRFHKKYYLQYHIKRILRWCMIGIGILSVIWVVMQRC